MSETSPFQFRHLACRVKQLVMATVATEEVVQSTVPLHAAAQQASFELEARMCNPYDVKVSDEDGSYHVE